MSECFVSSAFFFSSSPASDLTVRRDVFSRRQYGSVELVSTMYMCATVLRQSDKCLWLKYPFGFPGFWL